MEEVPPPGAAYVLIWDIFPICLVAWKLDAELLFTENGIIDRFLKTLVRYVMHLLKFDSIRTTEGKGCNLRVWLYKVEKVCSRVGNLGRNPCQML